MKGGFSFEQKKNSQFKKRNKKNQPTHSQLSDAIEIANYYDAVAFQ